MEVIARAYEWYLKMGPGRALKRTRAEDQQSFWGDSEDDGVYLTITLTSGNQLKGRGWPYIQQCVRAILGEREKLAKASFQNDGSLLVKPRTVAKRTNS